MRPENLVPPLPADAGIRQFMFKLGRRRCQAASGLPARSPEQPSGARAAAFGDLKAITAVSMARVRLEIFLLDIIQ